MNPQAQAELRVGATICNKWKLEKLLGVGGMAAVYVAVHKIGRREAIKILHHEVAQAPDTRARFEQEAHAANRLNGHPGAVEIRDIDVTDDGAPFLVMELLSGESLNERARRLGGIELPKLLRLVDELLDVLVAAHGKGIVHRDIKLDNLFVQKDGRLKVLDFGIARIRDGLPAQMRTRSGAMLGTAPYMPPEQIKGLDVDARADLFAVGATMFRLIAKRRIHEATSETELLLKMAIEPAPPLLAVAADTPRDVCLVVDRALMFDRERRYPDAATMQRDVRAIRAGQPPPYASARMLEADSPRSGGTAAAPPTPSEAPTRLGAEAMIASPRAGVVVRPAEQTRTESDIGMRPTLDAPSPEVAPIPVPIPILLPPVSGSAGVGATALPAGAAPGSRTMAVGPRAQIAGGIGTDLNLPTWTAGGGRAIDPIQAAPPGILPRILKRPLSLLIFGGVFLLLGIGGTLFWALSSDTEGAAPAASADASPGRTPKPGSTPPSKGSRSTKTR